MPRPVGRPTTPPVRTDAPKSTRGTVVKYPKLDALIDAAKSKLYLRLNDLHDPDVMAHLRSAAKRGVDGHVVVTSKKALPPDQAMNVFGLAGAGVHVTVGNTQ